MEESSASHPFGRLEEARCRNAGLRGGRSGKEVGAEARSTSALLESCGGEGGCEEESGAAGARKAWGWRVVAGGEPEKKSQSRY